MHRILPNSRVLPTGQIRGENGSTRLGETPPGDGRLAGLLKCP